MGFWPSRQCPYIGCAGRRGANVFYIVSGTSHPYPDPCVDPQRRPTLRLHDLHHRAIGALESRSGGVLIPSPNIKHPKPVMENVGPQHAQALNMERLIPDVAECLMRGRGLLFGSPGGVWLSGLQQLQAVCRQAASARRTESELRPILGSFC